MAVDLKYALLRDLKDLYNELENESNDDYNVILKVEQVNFKAHSVILKTRSEYFRNLINKDKAAIIKLNKFNRKINLEIPNIYPKVFTLCLRYIYTGEFSLQEQTDEFIFDLFVTADKLSLTDMVNYLQRYLIEKKSLWIEQNLIEVYQTSLNHQNFTILRNQCEYIIEQSPELIFNSRSFPTLEKKLLLDLIKRDDIPLSEVEIWRYLIKWGLEQEPIMNEDTQTWSSSDTIEFEKRIRDFVPYIRFFVIPSEQYFSCVRPYKDVLPQKKIEQLEEYYLVKGTPLPPDALRPRKPKRKGSKYKSTSRQQQSSGGKQPLAETIPDTGLQRKISKLAKPPIVAPRSPKKSNENELQSSRNVSTPSCNISNITNNLQLSRISHLIDGPAQSDHISTSNINNEFILLIKGSWDNLTKENFHLQCDNKGPTLFLAKVDKTNDVIGGYNPYSWSRSNSWMETTKSFIFSFKSDGKKESADGFILSRVADPTEAIWDGDYNFDIGFGYDLQLFKGEYKRENYKNRIMDDGKFKIIEYEIYKVERKD